VYESAFLKSNQKIPYDGTEINVGGGFDVDTGIFTVPTDGVYVFFFSAEAYTETR